MLAIKFPGFWYPFILGTGSSAPACNDLFEKLHALALFRSLVDRSNSISINPLASHTIGKTADDLRVRLNIILFVGNPQ
jgi:hypothetical protein